MNKPDSICSTTWFRSDLIIFLEIIEKTIEYMKKNINRIKLMPDFTKCMSLAIFLTFYGNSNANNSELTYAEQTNFTISMENQTLKSVVEWIEKNSQFIFIYDTDLDLSHRVSVDVYNKPVEEILKQIFSGTNLEYNIRNRQVMIRKAEVETAPVNQFVQQEKVTIKGAVTDIKGEAIIGANIIEDGTTNGTITDIDGQFSLQVDKGAKLIISYIGYMTRTLPVGQNHF